ncbi:MAG TPA: questin oxidase family protein [Magnetospirillaceae bacterium]
MSMPQAAAKAPNSAAIADPELTRLIAKTREFSAEFPVLLANHLPMVLVALRRMGASDERLNTYFEYYRDTNKLAALPRSMAQIKQDHWADALGDRTRETDYRAFFVNEVTRRGVHDVIAAYLPALVPGIAASAFHAFMRLAYGVLNDDRVEVGTALGYWAATYLPLVDATGAQPITADPAVVLLRLRDYPTFKNVEVELDLLWHFMRSVAAKPEFKPAVDWLEIVPGTHDKIAKTSLALMAGTMDFCAVHAVTGTHWIRILTDYWPNQDLALRYFWAAIATLYPKIGFPDLPSAKQLDDWRHAPCPDWPEIFAKTIQSNDEHDHSYVFSSHEEWKFYGDPLYRFVAARRVGLIS